MKDKFLKIKEVAEIFGVTPLTLRNWDKKGLLTAFRNPLNNYRLYRYADIADLLAEIKNNRRDRAPIRKIAVRIEDEQN